MERRPIVTTFPSSDGAFRRAAQGIVVDDNLGAKDELERRLKPLFPRVAVVERQLTGEPPQFYAFRDGTFIATPDDRWWEAEDVARVCLDALTGRLTEISPAYAAIMGAARQDLVGRHYLDFVDPDAAKAADAMFEATANDREVTTEAIVRRLDGTMIRMQLHARREEDQIDVRCRLAQQASTPS